MLVTVRGRYMLSPSFLTVRMRVDVLLDDELVGDDLDRLARDRLGHGFQRATTPRGGTVAPSAGETSFGPAGMSCVSHAVPAVRPARTPFSIAGPSIAHCLRKLRQHLLDRDVRVRGLDRLENSSVSPSLPSEPRPWKVNTRPSGLRVEPPPALAVDESLEAGVLVRCVVFDVELGVFQRDDLGRNSRGACRGLSAEPEPWPALTYTPAPASMAADDSNKVWGGGVHRSLGRVVIATDATPLVVTARHE